MAAIDHERLSLALDRAGMTPRQLSEATGISLQYACDILSGRRTLKRNPELRKKIAATIKVPVDWIEVERPLKAAS